MNTFKVKELKRKEEYDILIGNKLMQSILDGNIEKFKNLLETSSASILMPFSIDGYKGHVIDFILSNKNEDWEDIAFENDQFFKKDNFKNFLENNSHLFDIKKALKMQVQIIETDNIKKIEKINKAFNLTDFIPNLIAEYCLKWDDEAEEEHFKKIMFNYNLNLDERNAVKLTVTNPNMVIWLLSQKDNFKNLQTTNPQSNFMSAMNNYSNFGVNTNLNTNKNAEINRRFKQLLEMLQVIIDTDNNITNAAEIRTVLMKENLEKNLIDSTPKVTTRLKM